MINELSKAELAQLSGSIEKLFHYLVPYVTTDTKVTVTWEDVTVYEKEYTAPRDISLSSTLYTRIDNCHGAGNCCRVPFDLVYTAYDRERIINYDEAMAAKDFGEESAARFTAYRETLLRELIKLDVRFENEDRIWWTSIWVKLNLYINPMSGTTSCPFLFMGEDRYFCGVHPFKPLHCWYPHMVVRVNDRTQGESRPTITIGRMQYGRNHKFGCPVQFQEVEAVEEDGLFTEAPTGPDYFEKQAGDDYDKLAWTAFSARSLGFLPSENVATRIHEHHASSCHVIQRALQSRKYVPIPIWRNDEHC